MKVRDETYKYYFYFMQERMNIFWKRYEGYSNNLTNDGILSKNKFTNVYRAQDRVSQYLIRNVIYKDNGGLNEMDVLLRILVFKVFNNIKTWEFIQDKIGQLQVKNFDVALLSKLLSERIKNQPIFSPAYMMTGSHGDYKMYQSKHEKWLRMIDLELIKNKGFNKIIGSKSLSEVFDILYRCPFIGGFLAYQYAIDFNYSEVINFEESSFVKAGIGAIRGIKKCFTGIDNYSYEDCIRYTRDNIEKYQQKYGYTDFRNLWGRGPQLIDLQSCFCETDKYLRVKMPEIIVDNIRIKQKFDKPKGSIDFFFPPKWNINKNIEPCSVENSPALTLF